MDAVTTPSLPWASLAGRALHHAIAERTDIAHRCINRIAAVYGPDVMPMVLLAWVDVTISELFPGGPPDPEKFGGLMFLDVNRRQIQRADEAPSGVRWAGRFLTARLLDDEAQAVALVAAPASEREWAECVAGTLNVCATAIRVRRLAVGGHS